MATIRAEDHQIDIRDGADGPVQTVADGRAALEALHHVARAAALRDLAGELEPPPWSRCLVRWGEVQGGRRGPPLPPRGSRVRAGAALWIAVENRADHDLWLTVLDLSIHGEVGMLTRVAPPGLWLRRGCEIVVGEVQGRLVGCPVSWPAEVPAGCADESLLVLAMDRACDLSGLVTVVAKDSSPLPNVLAPLARHPVSDKEIAPAKSAPLRVEVHAIDFVLDSAPAPGP